MSDKILQELVSRGVSPETIIAVAKLIADAEQTNGRRERNRDRMRSVRARAHTGAHTETQTNGYTNLSFLKDRPPKKRERSVAAKIKTAMPNDWKPKPEHFELAQRLHLWGPSDVMQSEDYFRDNALAKDWRYKDWDRAFNNCIRERWGRNDRRAV